MAIGLLASLLLTTAFAATSTVDVRSDGATYSVHASGVVPADARTAFETLTDYEHLRDFVPDIESSRVVSRDGNGLLVEYVGAFQLLWFSMPVRVRLAVQHQPYVRVVAGTAPGLVGSEEPTLRSMVAQYTVTPSESPARDVRVDYDARFELAEGVSTFIDTLFGDALVKRGLRRHFEAMLAEIERRQTVAAVPATR